MTQWNKETEQVVRALGDHFEKQMKDFFNPRTTVTGSLLRIVFRHAVEGRTLKRKVKEAGLATRDWRRQLQYLADVARQNGSDAGVKIEKALAQAERFWNYSETCPHSTFRCIKNMKKQGYSF